MDGKTLTPKLRRCDVVKMLATLRRCQDACDAQNIDPQTATRAMLATLRRCQEGAL